MKKIFSVFLAGMFLATAVFGAGITKTEYSSSDASSAVMYGTADAGDTIVRVKTAADGTLQANITGSMSDVSIADATISGTWTTTASWVGDFPITGDMKVTGDFTTSGSFDWSGGNVVHVPLTGSIADAITAAAAGDTLQLGAGTYTITTELTVNKKLHIRGMGEGITTITSSTNNLNMINFTTTSGSLLSNLTVAKTGAMTTTGKYQVTGSVPFSVENVEFLNTCTGGAIETYAVGTNTAFSGTIKIDNSQFSMTGAIGTHLAIYFGSSTTNVLVIVNNCTGVGENGTTAAYANSLVYTAKAAVTLYDSYFSSVTDSTGGVAISNGGSVRIYGGAYSGSGTGAFDVKQIGSGTLTLYNTTLVNNKTSGTITYGGTVVSGDAYIDDDLRVNGDLNGIVQSTKAQHEEIGILLDILTAPKAIVGFTGTGATTTTETGYESGSGRTWTYSGGLATDKIFQGQTYVYSFDGVDSYLSTPDTADMSFALTAASWGGWVQIVDASEQSIMSKYDAPLTTREWAVDKDSSEKIKLYIYDETEDKECTYLTDAAVSVGWHHIVVTYDGAANTSGVVVYVDGVAVAGTPTNDGAFVSMRDTAATPVIGTVLSNGSPTLRWSGDMGRLFVTAEELTAAQVWKLYEKTRGFYNK